MMSKKGFITGGIAILVFLSVINLSYSKEGKETQSQQSVQKEITKIKEENQKLKDYVQQKIEQDNFNKLKAITESFYHQTKNLLTLISFIIPIITVILTLFLNWIIQQTQLKSFEKKLEESLGQIRTEQEEIGWIKKLKEKVKTDPFLRDPNSIETIQSIGEHFFNDQDNLAWELYGVGRYFDNREEHPQALQYYEEAEGKKCKDKDLMLHIYQSIGVDYFRIGKSRERNNQSNDATNYYKKAIEYYEKVIKEDPQFVEAHNNKGITLIELGKLEVENKYYEKAILCLDKVIEIEPTNYDPYYDKARAYALLQKKDDAIKSLKNSFRLAKPKAVNELLKHLKDDIEDFKSVKDEEEFKKLVERYEKR